MKKSSTKPEGATSYKETAFGIIPRNKLLKLEIEGTKKGLDFLYELIKTNDKKDISSDFICKLQNVSFGWIFPKWAGKLCTIQVTYSGKEAPKSFLVPQMTDNLCKDLDERIKYLPKTENPDFITDIVELLAWFKHGFVVIHPFQDYNGRIARMLTIYILLILNLPPLEILAENSRDRKRYITVLQKADNGDFPHLKTLSCYH